MTHQDQGASASPTGLSPSGPSQQAVSSADAVSIPSAEHFANAKDIRRFMLNGAGEIVCYGWDAEFATKYLRNKSKQCVDEIGPVSIAAFTTEQCDELGFGTWSEDDPIRLIPIWLYPHLCPGDTLRSICGETKVVGSDYREHGDGYIDNDCRFGCLAYGVIPAASLSR